MSHKKRNTNLVVRILMWSNIFLAAIYLLSAYIGYINPEKCGFLALAGLSYPIFLFLMILTLPCWLILKKKYSLITVVALIITIPQILTFSPLNYNRFWSDRSKGDFVLMTYNIFGLKNEAKQTPGEGHPSINEILKYDPDFVCLQEMGDIDHLEQRGLSKAQITLLHKRYPYMIAPDSISIACFSKTPTELLRVDDDKRYFSSLIYKTVIDNTTTYIFNVHLESIGLTPDDKKLYMELTSVDDNKKSLEGVRSRLMTKLSNAFKRRASQARHIRELIDSLNSADPKANIFLCGDFNDSPYSYSYLTVKGNLHDAYTDAGIGPTYTYNANRFYFKIDQMFYKGDSIEAISTRRGNARSSDHYPLVAIFRKKTTN